MKHALTISVIVAFSVAFASLAGIPKDVQGFAKWQKVVTTGMPLDGPHAGLKKVVYANPIAAKAWKGKAALPVGSLVVKTAGPASSPDFIAIMRKSKSGWQYEEYLLKSGKYSLFLAGAACSGCHEGAKGADYLFTRQ